MKYKLPIGTLCVRVKPEVSEIVLTTKLAMFDASETTINPFRQVVVFSLPKDAEPWEEIWVKPQFVVQIP